MPPRVRDFTKGMKNEWAMEKEGKKKKKEETVESSCICQRCGGHSAKSHHLLSSPVPGSAFRALLTELYLTFPTAFEGVIILSLFL